MYFLLAAGSLAIAAVLSMLWLYSRYVAQVPRAYTKFGSSLHTRIHKHLPLLKAEYRPTWWCPFGTLQTVARQLFRDCPKLPFIREIVEFSDGGALGIDWLMPDDCTDETPIIVFLPGITGSTQDSSYVLHPVMEARDRGWRSVVVNPRGLGGVNLRTKRTYNAASHTDIKHVIELVTERYPKAKKIGCGFSMGGMILWNYLARCQTAEEANLDAAMIISSPFDPVEASKSIEEFIPRIIFNRFLARSLCNVIKPYRELFEKYVDFDHVLMSRTVREFDTRFVAPMFGYESCSHYYADATLKTKVKKIRIPTICLNAVDDSFSPVEAIPLADASESETVVCLVTAHGGHTAFMERADPSARGLVEKLLAQWGTMIFEDRQ